MTGELPNAELKLDGAKFFLERLKESRDEPRAFYHYMASFIGNLRSIDYALESEASDQYKTWKTKWRKECPTSDGQLIKDIFGYRDRDVHEKEGLPLNIAVPIHGHARSGTVAIRLRKGVQLLITVTTTSTVDVEMGDIEFSVPSETMMQSGHITHEVHGDGSATKGEPSYSWDKIPRSDVLDWSRTALAVAERALKAFRVSISNT